MFGYIDLTPERLRSIAKTIKKSDRETLLYAATSLESHDEVIDGLASREREKVQQEVGALRARVAALESENRVLRAAVAVHNQMRSKIRDWWKFGVGRFAQEHAHSWHTREDFIELWDKELAKATEQATADIHPVPKS